MITLRTGFIWLIAALLCLGGCGPRKSVAPAPDRPLAGRSFEQASDELVRGTNAEQSRVGDLDASIPLPPGVEADALASRPADHPTARVELRSAIKSMAEGANTLAIPSAAPEVSPEAKAEALRLYVKGRNAALDRMHLQATVDLQKAHELDPTSPEIIRELANCYVVQNRTSLAVELYEKLLRLEPSNPEALFTVALAAVNRRDFVRAARLLAWFRHSNHRFSHDSAADVLADFTLAVALRELGYDRAFIELASATIDFSEPVANATGHRQRLESVYRQRAETWRMIGDAHCRLGEFPHAIRAYEIAASLPNPDPSALHPRVIYAHLRLRHVHSAQLQLLEYLRQAERGVDDRDIRLCGYLASNAQPVNALASAVTELYRQRPDDSGLVRAAASLLEPPQARELLADFVNRRPRDLETVTQLLSWLASDKQATAIELVISLASHQPDLANAYSDRLSVIMPDPAVTLEVMQSLPASATRAFVEARLLAKNNGFGEAWSICRAARQRWPNDVALMSQELQLAAAMQESGLFEQSLASMPEPNTANWLVAVSQACRTLGQTQRAIEHAQKAVELEPRNIEAMIELARAVHAHATVLASALETKADAQPHVERARRLCEEVIALAPQREEPYEVLILISSSGGAMADAQEFRQARERLSRAIPNSPLAIRLSAQELMAQKRFEQAVERLLSLHDANAADQTALTHAVSAWQQWGRLDAAQQWIEQRLAERPGDPILLQQSVRVQLLRNDTAGALTRLQSRFAEQPKDFAARRILETVYQLSGQASAALELGEARLMARPQGVRREIELAELHAAAESAEPALERLMWVRDNAHLASHDDLSQAIAIASRLGGDTARRDELSLDLVRRAIANNPKAHLLDVYGRGLLALARLNRLDQDFDALLDNALRHGANARQQNLQGANVWRELAQLLVDDGHAEAAAIAMRTRLRFADKLNPAAELAPGNTPETSSDGNPNHAPLDLEAAALLARVALVCDAAAARAAHDLGKIETEVRHAENAITFIRSLDRQNVLKQALGLPSRSSLADAYDTASQYFSKLGAKHGAMRLLREVVTLQPANPAALNNLGYMAIENGRADEEAIGWIETAFALTPDEPNLLDTVGWLRYKQGRFRDGAPANVQPDPELEETATQGALSLIQRSIDANRETSPEVLDHLGDVHWRLGETEQALDAWRKAARFMNESAFQQNAIQQNSLIQSRFWFLLVEDPREMYDREYGFMLQGIKAKINAAEQGERPEVAPTFEELLNRPDAR